MTRLGSYICIFPALNMTPKPRHHHRGHLTSLVSQANDDSVAMHLRLRTMVGGCMGLQDVKVQAKVALELSKCVSNSLSLK